MTTDPTRQEMLDALRDEVGTDEELKLACEEAIWWFANDYHGGQWSNLYAALCASPYIPSPTNAGLSEAGTDLYCQLEALFIHAEGTASP